MLDIMKAFFYSLRKGNAIWYSIGVIILMEATIGFSAYVQMLDMTTAVVSNIDSWMFTSFLVVMVFIAVTIGDDFKNKTLYYEIMSGHQSYEIILGRLVPVFLFSGVLLLLGLVATYGFGLVWGNWCEVLGSTKVIFIRCLLLIYNSLPFIAFCILSIFVTKNIVTAIALNWGMYIVLQIPTVMQSLGITYSTSSNMWLYLNMKNIVIQKLTLSLCLNMMIISTVKCIFIIALTFWMFKRSDLK